MTYPQFLGDDISDGLLDFLYTRFSDTIFCIVAREAHKDGSPHYHCLLSTSDHHHVRDSSFFDFAGRHGNYQGCRNTKRTYQYCTKAGSFKERGQQHFLNTSETREEFLQRIIADPNPTASFNSATRAGQIPIRGYKRLRDDFFAVLGIRNTPTVEPMLNVRFNACTIGTQLTYLFKSTFKYKQLYIWGPPNTGKTSLLQQYDQRYIFHAPNNNDWQGLDENFHKMIVFDEFHGQIPLSIILQLLQGTRVRLNTKGGSVDISKNLPKIFLSNVSPKNCYKHSDAFMTRLTVFYFHSFQTLTL